MPRRGTVHLFQIRAPRAERNRGTPAQRQAATGGDRL